MWPINKIYISGVLAKMFFSLLLFCQPKPSGFPWSTKSAASLAASTFSNEYPYIGCINGWDVIDTITHVKLLWNDFSMTQCALSAAVPSSKMWVCFTSWSNCLWTGTEKLPVLSSLQEFLYQYLKAIGQPHIFLLSPVIIFFKLTWRVLSVHLLFQWSLL